MCIDRGFDVIENENEMLMTTHSLYTPNEVFQLDFADLVTLLFQDNNNHIRMSNTNRMVFNSVQSWDIEKDNCTKVYNINCSHNSKDNNQNDIISRSNIVGPLAIQNEKINLIKDMNIVDVIIYLKKEFGMIKAEVYDGKK